MQNSIQTVQHTNICSYVLWAILIFLGGKSYTSNENG